MKSADRSEKRFASREKIMSEAIAVAEEIGWNKLTVRNLTDRLNYAAPVLYQYFDNKDHLTRSIVEEGFATLTAQMRFAADSHMKHADKLVAIARARFRFAAENHALHSIMFTAGGNEWQREAAFKGMCGAAELVSSLLSNISGRKDACQELMTNFIAIIKGYTYMAIELPAESACNRFFASETPENALAKAIERFIISIQPLKNE